MNDDALTRLECRIAKLETSIRRWKRFGACSVAVFACLGLMAAQRSNVFKTSQIEAQRIIIRDAEGHELITLGMLEKKYPGMEIKSLGSAAHAMFFTSNDHVTLALSDYNGASSITLNSGTAQYPPDFSMVRVTPDGKAQRLFRAPAPGGQAGQK